LSLQLHGLWRVREALTIPATTRIVELLSQRLPNSIFLQGLPGLGFVGKVTVDYLIEKLKAKKFAELHSTHLTFPDGNVGINIALNGTFSLPKYEFYIHTETSPNLVLLTGDAQPNVSGQYEVADAVLDFVEKVGCGTIVCIGGYGVRVQREIGTVYGVLSNHESVDELKKYGVQIARGGAVTGACGIILGLAMQRKMRCFGLLGSTRGMYPDLEAARAVILLLKEMYGIPVELTDLDSEIADMKTKMESLQRIQAEGPREFPGEKKERRGGGYIT